jgi:hypothetical protein
VVEGVGSCTSCAHDVTKAEVLKPNARINSHNFRGM